jgi:endo-1,4-beta-xylanase
MDVHINLIPGEMPERLALQRNIYHDMVTACLAVARCDSVTFWGFTDKYTWVNDFLGLSDRPLSFDAAYRPKAAFFDIRDALLGF